METDLRGQLVAITGASSGIGAESARQFAAAGAHVLLLARTLPALEELAAELRSAGGTAHAFALDLADEDSIPQVAEAIVAQAGLPDLLVNNAGAGRWLGIEETSPHDALEMTAVPYTGALALTAALAPAMIRRGSGQIINVTSPAAFTPFPGAVAYSVARGAMRLFTNALHADLRGTGLCATLVVLGEVESPYFARNPGSRERLPGIARILPILTMPQAAAAIVRSAQRRPRRLVQPPLLRAILWLWTVAPWLVQWLVTVTGHRRRRRFSSRRG